MGIVRGHIHHYHPATLYLFVESTLIVLARSLEPMVGRAPSDLQLTNRDCIRMLPMIGFADLFCQKPVRRLRVRQLACANPPAR